MLIPMVPRDNYLRKIRSALDRSPVAAILGPRQSGKTTLARIIAEEKNASYLDLENPEDLSRLSNPMLFLKSLSGLVVIDEIQRRPELFEILRVLADDPECRARFLVLGSASPRLIKGASESLAGRIAFVDLSGFDLSEIGTAEYHKLWLRGGFPLAFLAAEDTKSCQWRNDFIRTFLERDVPQLGITIPAETLRRFWTMVSHYHGQVWNAAEFARSLGTAEATARRYLDILSGAYLVRQLPSWFENIRKRQVKSPKIYVRDSGLLHALLGVSNEHDLAGHPKIGASWEGFAVEQILSLRDTRDAYFWATHTGAELDLMILNGIRRIGFEIKYTDAPRTTRSMHIALNDLQLDRLYVLHPGQHTYLLDKKITALSIRDLQRQTSDPNWQEN
jgi:predicted AAA+ superfamily ATPase